MNKLNNICWLTCTHGRYKCLQRNLKCFLDQDYLGDSYMYICNTGTPLFLEKENQITHLECNTSCKSIYINNCINKIFTSVGEKYNYAVNQILHNTSEVDIIVCCDDDDIFLPNHLSEGNKGFNRGVTHNNLKAYKPSKSFYRSQEGVFRNGNNYEGSIFVEAQYLKEEGFAPVSVKYHQQWLDPLFKKELILEDPNGVSTFIYNWGDTWDTYKLSGLGKDNDFNFQQHQKSSLDMGNGILIPNVDNQGYYDEVKFAKQL